MQDNRINADIRDESPRERVKFHTEKQYNNETGEWEVVFIATGPNGWSASLIDMNDYFGKG